MAPKKGQTKPSIKVKCKQVIDMPEFENKPLVTRPHTVPDELIAQALYGARGKQTLAAEKLKIAASTLHGRIAQSPFLQEVLNHSKELLLDKAEQALHELIEEKKEFPAICFFLKTRGKERGYEESPSLVISPDHEKKFEGLMNSLKEIQSSISSSKIDERSETTEFNSD